MPDEVLAIAIFEPIKGKDKQCLAVTRELFDFLRRKGYGRDLLYRDAKNPRVYLNFRYWASEKAALAAHQDPELHQFWARLAKVCRIKKIYERLEEVEAFARRPSRAPKS